MAELRYFTGLEEWAVGDPVETKSEALQQYARKYTTKSTNALAAADTVKASAETYGTTHGGPRIAQISSFGLALAEAMRQTVASYSGYSAAYKKASGKIATLESEARTVRTIVRGFDPIPFGEPVPYPLSNARTRYYEIEQEEREILRTLRQTIDELEAPKPADVDHGALANLLNGIAADPRVSPRTIEMLELHAAYAKDASDGTTDTAAIDRMVADGFTPLEAAQVVNGEFTREDWERVTARRAGINLDSWDTSKGTAANRENIEAVYNYYGNLFLDDPDFQWAGMAAMIGPSFASGMEDLGMFGDWAHATEQVMEKMPPGALPADGFEGLANLTEKELAFYETTLLSMQKEIFLDMGPMHEAYKYGGIEAIQQMEDDLSPGQLPMWEEFDDAKKSGDETQIADANERFLLREQRDIIDDDYRDMKNRFPTGEAMTYGITTFGEPSIPNAKGYAEQFPLIVEHETPGIQGVTVPNPFGPDINVDNPTQVKVTVETPLPDGNIADFEDRWRLIQEDTLPSYQNLSDEEIRATLETDFQTRVDESRVSAEQIVERLQDWEVDYEQ